jgi:hypothetical protein
MNWRSSPASCSASAPTGLAASAACIDFAVIVAAAARAIDSNPGATIKGSSHTAEQSSAFIVSSFVQRANQQKWATVSSSAGRSTGFWK